MIAGPSLASLAGWRTDWLRPISLGTFLGTCSVPVPLAQLNLKIPEAVRAYWQREAAAAGLSVRDWLIRQTMPGEAPPTAPEPDLSDRVEKLERQVAELLTRPASVRRDPPVRQPPELQQFAPASELEGVEGAAVARSLGLSRGAWNARVSREGGARQGLVVSGWRCIGLRQPQRGGPRRAVWVPDAEA
jgi:hypothetical protein